MRLFALLFTMLAAPLSAHEFWVEPHAYQVPDNGIVTADLVNGQEFEGIHLGYIPQRFTHFVVMLDGSIYPVDGRVGDTPALNVPASGDGLHVIAYQARPATVSYENWEKFQRFVDHKDLGDVRSLHDARGLPEADFVEVYSRYSKSLVGVGDAAGSDKRTGLETEIVALTNPYTDDLSGGMKLQLYYGSDVRANEQVEVFEKAPDGAVIISLYRTDAQGIATIPQRAGHSYMADAVVLREPGAQLAADTRAVWETLWANITWAAP